MPIPLNPIPSHIADSIVQKLTLDDFVNFHQCSKKSFVIGQNIKTRFLVSEKLRRRDVILAFEYVHGALWMAMCMDNKGNLPNMSRTRDNKYPLRYEANEMVIRGNLTETFCISLIEYLLNTNSSTESVAFYKITCSASSFERLLKTANAKEVIFMEPVSPEYLRVELMTKMKAVEARCSLTDSDLLRLKAVRKLQVKTTNITSTGINALLKECLKNKTSFDTWAIETNLELQKEVMLSGISHRNCGIFVGMNEFSFVGEELQILVCPNCVVIIPFSE